MSCEIKEVQMKSILQYLKIAIGSMIIIFSIIGLVVSTTVAETVPTQCPGPACPDPLEREDITIDM